MTIKLKLFLIIICILFDIFIWKKVQNEKLQLGQSFIWFLLSFILIFVTIFDNVLVPIQQFLGFETISNMIFLIGFFLLTLITFSINIKISEQTIKIKKLTQELALLKKESINNENKRNSK